MNKGFSILQANLRKMPGAQLSLLNDGALRDYKLLLITEPYCLRIEGKTTVPPRSHAYWTPTVPTVEQEESRWPFRSMIWTHRSLTTFPIPVNSPDITAIRFMIGERIILVFSVYVPPPPRAKIHQLWRTGFPQSSKRSEVPSSNTALTQLKSSLRATLTDTTNCGGAMR